MVTYQQANRAYISYVNLVFKFCCVFFHVIYIYGFSQLQKVITIENFQIYNNGMYLLSWILSEEAESHVEKCLTFFDSWKVTLTWMCATEYKIMHVNNYMIYILLKLKKKMR